MVNNEKHTLRSGNGYIRLLVSCSVRQIARQNPEKTQLGLVAQYTAIGTAVGSPDVLGDMMKCVYLHNGFLLSKPF
jgi:hypothetical protein